MQGPLGEDHLHGYRDGEEHHPDRLERDQPPQRGGSPHVCQRGPQPTAGALLVHPPGPGQPGGDQAQRDQREQAAVGQQRRDGAPGHDHRSANRRSGHEADREHCVVERVSLRQQIGRHELGRGRGARERPRNDGDDAVGQGQPEHRGERKAVRQPGQEGKDHRLERVQARQRPLEGEAIQTSDQPRGDKGRQHLRAEEESGGAQRTAGAPIDQDRQRQRPHRPRQLVEPVGDEQPPVHR